MRNEGKSFEFLGARIDRLSTVSEFGLLYEAEKATLRRQDEKPSEKRCFST